MKPTSEAELAEIICDAHAPMAIRGGGTRLRGIQAVEQLETHGITGITLYDPSALTMVARAGTTLDEIEAVLATENQRLAFEPADMRAALGTTGSSTIGGVMANNASGPRRISVGACRDFMLGVRFVDGQGQIIKNGGRVMKNVTGYDLVKLMSGAHGVLGVLSEVSFKVLPKVEMQATLALPTQDIKQAIQAMSAAFASPYDVSGATYSDEGQVLLRLEGFEPSVRYRGAELIKVLKRFGDVSFIDDQAKCTTLWNNIRDIRDLANQDYDLWRISVRPSDAPQLVAALQPQRKLLDWGGGLIWAQMPRGFDVRAKMDVAGHATLVRADAKSFEQLGRFHPEPAPVAKISAGLRMRFDPKGLFNPGLMGAIA
ncbi:FAD-binding protein [Planktotalea sp.]|uniref:FAD-binding protein n=1 Tax=Planktotalea sp. TaxID=2029877 RepID=UPI003D6A52B1